MYAPELSVVVVAVAAPLRVTVAPLPPVVGEIVPEMLKVCAVAVKFVPEVTFAPLIVTVALVGLKVYPAWLGVMVYVPFAKPVKVYAPELSAVVVADPAPLKVTVAPLPPAVGLIVPEMLYVDGGGGLV